MSIRKKGRRKIVCGDKQYIWYVHYDNESPYCLLNVAAEDKSLIISCPLNMELPYVIIYNGTYFQGEKIDGFSTSVIEEMDSCTLNNYRNALETIVLFISNKSNGIIELKRVEAALNFLNDKRSEDVV